MEESFNPWLSIWTKPRATIRRIVDENPNRSLWLLAAIYGFVSLMNNAQTLALGQSLHTAVIFFMVLILAPFWGYAFFSIWSAAVYLIGKLFKGQGSFSMVRSAYAWSSVPFVFNLILWISLAVIFGPKLFMPAAMTNEITEPLMLFLFFVLVGRLVLAVWSLVIYFNTLAEVQSYSVLKAIFNVVIAAILMALISWFFWNAGMYLLGPNNQTLKIGFFLILGVK